MVARSEGDLREVDLVCAAEAADRVGEAGASGVVDPAAGRGEIDPAASCGARVGELEDALVDGDAAGEGVGGGEIERPGAVQGEAPGAGVGARAARAGLIGDDA
jgi:hypothetical protein